ncbi:glycosyltransferase [Haliea sp. E1-2-M8]|uniref:glycosyltransferase n=1 Tax=Haliea sp. E1-2-M8 TaxID=3064706 RepID=UPI00271BCE1D|nr:glycosyltransferase [Haliea sp. E1-2-M8]MDO8860419.1 glycosyltransferase [Haliea sp. E1-2-M8]
MILVNLSNLPFSTMRKRNQSIFVNLVEGESIFTSGIFVDVPQYLPRSASLIDRLKARKTSQRVKRFSSKIKVLSPVLYLPFSYRRPVAKILSSCVVKKVRGLIGNQRYCLWINSPEASFLYIADGLMQGAEKVVVDLSDDFTAFKNAPDDDVDGRLKHYTEKAHAVIAINKHVASKYPHWNTYIFPNCTDYSNFAKDDPYYYHPPVLPKPVGTKYVGFIGGFNKGRIDEPLVTRLLSQFPDITFIFVGYTNDKSLRKEIAEVGSNVLFIESVPYEILPYFIKSFDVAIVPHLINEHTRGNDLLKVLDYMACGVPVVTTNCSNVSKFADALYVAQDHDEFISLVRSLIDSQKKHDPQKGITYAKKFSWSSTVPQLAKFLNTGHETTRKLNASKS